MVRIYHRQSDCLSMIPAEDVTKAEKSKIPLEDIKQATNNFAPENSIERDQLYWEVHKGELSGEMLAFITTGGGLAIMMSKLFELTKHPNIVSLIGFCYEDGNSILVREHPTHGGLDEYLKKNVKDPNLKWLMRAQISLDIASGLHSLHSKTLGIGDLNSASIHLDEYLQAKIQLISPGVLWNLANRMLADHWQDMMIGLTPDLQTGMVSQIDDIYSFGVILLELLCEEAAEKEFRSEFARSPYEEGTLTKIINPVLREQMNRETIAIFSKLAHQCLNEDPFKRPEISEVKQQLQKVLKLQKCFESWKLQQAALKASLDRLTNAENAEWSVPSDFQEIMQSSQAMDQSELIKKLLSTGVLIDNGEKRFSLSKVNYKKCHMLPATAVINTKEPTDAKFTKCPSSTMPRFEEVVELQGDVAFNIECVIETKMLSPDTTYACYLVFQLPENDEGDECLVKAWGPIDLYSDLDTSKLDGWKNTIIYLTAPGPIDLYGDKSVPKYREDGWMEVKVWEFVYKNEIKDIPMKLKLIYWGRTIAGLTVCGVEFRPIDIYGRHTKIWGDKQSVPNGYFGSKLFNNSDIAKEFQNKLLPDSAENKTASKISLSNRSYNSTHDEFLNRFPICSIKDIRDLDESRYAIVFACILGLEGLETGNSWFYKSCPKCNQKVSDKNEIVVDVEGNEPADVNPKNDNMWCKTCKTNPQFVIPRFKVQIRVEDGKGITSFILFDREVSRLISKSARELVEIQEQAGDAYKFPKALETIVGKKFAFKIDVAEPITEKGGYTYTVVKMTDDQHVIKELLKNLYNEESVNEQSASVNAESSFGCCGVKDALSMTGENKTPATVENKT